MSTAVSLPSRGHVNNVTGENFTKKAVAFVKTSESGEGFIIALRPYPGWPVNEKFIPTPRQWGAWITYWVKLPYKNQARAIQARGYATTPTEWPHEFDPQATIQGDHAAADEFEQRWRDERESRAFHVGGLVKASSKALEAWRYERASKPVPREHLAAPSEPRVDIGDFPDANASREELRAWEARQKASAS